MNELAQTPAPSAPMNASGRTVQLLAAAPAHLPVRLGVLQQQAVLEELLGAATAPADVVGLDVPPETVVAAWANDPIELVAGRHGGIVVQFGGALPHEIDGGIVGCLRDRGWLAIHVRSAADDPARLADAVTAACDALEDLAEGAAPRRIVLLGFGDGVQPALSVLEQAARTPTAVVVVSHPDADPIGVRRLDERLASVRVPVLHLRSAEAVGGSATIRDLIIHGGLEDTEPAAPGLTAWTYARRPGPGVAWLPMLVEPVGDWVDRVIRADLEAPAAARTAAATR